MLPIIKTFDDFFSRNSVEYTPLEVSERCTESELLPIIADFDGVICGDDQFTKKVLMAARRLKVISKWGTGVDSIDLAAAKSLGIRVCRTPNAFTNPVADSVMGYIISFARQLQKMNSKMKNGEWEKIPGRALSECSLGILGVGSIGKAVATRANSFGMKLLGHDIAPISKEFVQDHNIEIVGLKELCARSDFLTIHCDLNPTSRLLIGPEELKIMKSTAVLVNLARGGVVDEASLIVALSNKLIAGAALDVFELEPLPADSPLRSMENVMLAPHNSNSSPEAWKKVHTNTLTQLVDALKAAE